MDALNFLRQQTVKSIVAQAKSESNQPAASKSPYRSPYLWDISFWQSLDFFNVSRSSQQCHAYFTSLLYLELWHEKEYQTLKMRSTDDQFEDQVNVNTPLKINYKEVFELLGQIFSNIDEPDYIYGLVYDRW